MKLVQSLAVTANELVLLSRYKDTPSKASLSNSGSNYIIIWMKNRLNIITKSEISFLYVNVLDCFFSSTYNNATFNGEIENISSRY